MKNIHNWELSELVMRLHGIARELEVMDKMQDLNSKELRALADRIHRVGQCHEYTKEEQFVIDYAMAVSGGPVNSSDRNHH